MNKRKNRQDYYDEEDETSVYKTHKGKHKKHAHNVKGQGMRVINRYAEDEFTIEEYLDEEDNQSRNYKTRFYISTTR